MAPRDPGRGPIGLNLLHLEPESRTTSTPIIAVATGDGDDGGPAPCRAPASPRPAGYATRPSVRRPSGASAAAVTFRVARVLPSPISDVAALRPVGGDSA